jgi:hypothetical protein
MATRTLGFMCFVPRKANYCWTKLYWNRRFLYRRTMAPKEVAVTVKKLCFVNGHFFGSGKAAL